MSQIMNLQLRMYCVRNAVHCTHRAVHQAEICLKYEWVRKISLHSVPVRLLLRSLPVHLCPAVVGMVLLRRPYRT